MSVVFAKIQMRRGTAAEWASANPILAQGEQAFETDTGLTKIGDGATAYASLPAYATYDQMLAAKEALDEAALDVAAVEASRVSAAASAATASTKATEAVDAAAAALASEQSILAKVNQAEQARIDAIAYAAVAEQKADEIVASANAAAADASAADADRIAAEAARTGAEAAQAIAQGAAAGALASEVAADLSADLAAGSAAQALAIYGSVAAQQTAVATAQAQASLAAGHAASAASVVQQDLSGVTAQALHRSPNAITSMFIYDTSKDSDGGAWTEKCQHTSWWDEAINGKWLGAQASETAARAVSGAATGDYFQRTSDGRFYSLNDGSGITEVFRGNKRDFPRLAGIVAEATSVNIYDLTEPGRPMWMRFAANGHSYCPNPVAAVHALNGLIGFAGNATSNGFINGGFRVVDFMRDRALKYHSLAGANEGLSYFPVSGRNQNSAAGWISQALTVANEVVNAVAMTVLPDAPVDPVTGLRVPTIAVATNGGVSVIRHNGTVETKTPFAGAPQQSTVAFDGYYLAAGGVSTDAYNGAWVLDLRDGSIQNYGRYQNGVVSLNNNVGGNQVRRFGEEYAAIQGAGLNLLRQNKSAAGRAINVRIAPTFNTGWMTGDIRRCFLSDTEVGSATGPELVTNGTFDTDTTGWSSASAFASAASAVGGVMQVTAQATYGRQIIPISVTVGRTYLLTGSIRAVGGTAALGFATANGSTYLAPANETLTTSTTFVAVSRAVVAWDSTIYVFAGNQTNGQVAEFDNISVREVIADRSYKAAGAYITGTLTRAQLASGTSLVGYSGFSAANYLREPYSADLDFGTGEWTGSAWVNVPVWTLNPATFASGLFTPTGPNIVTNGTFDAPAADWAAVGPASLSVVDGKLRVEKTSSAATDFGAKLALSFPKPGMYRLSVVVNRNYSANNTQMAVQLRFGSVQTAHPFGVDTTVLVHAEIPSAGLHEIIVRSAFGGGTTGEFFTIDNVLVEEVPAAIIVDRAAASGPRLRLGVDVAGRLTAEAFDGTTTRTVTTSASYNTAQWLKARVNYTTDGTLAILVNGREVAATRGAPLLTLNNASAVLTIGNSFALDAPFPGSIALLKLGATVPTPEQATFMFEQEKQLFRAGALSVLPDSGAIVDMAYDDATDRWVAISAANESYWTGLVRNSVQAVPAGSFSRVVAGSGLELAARTGTNPGVDVTIPAYGLREELVRRAEAAARLSRELVAFDFVGGFTANTTNGSAAITNVAGLTYAGSLIGARVSGAGIPANTRIVGVSGTTIYLSAVCTATATGVSVSFLDFNLPVAFEARAVLSAGALRREGSTADFVRLHDGFLETIRFAVAPGTTAWVQIQATRGTMQ